MTWMCRPMSPSSECNHHTIFNVCSTTPNAYRKVAPPTQNDDADVHQLRCKQVIF